MFSAPPWINIYRQQIRLPDGRIVDDFHQVKLPDYVIVFAQARDGRVLLERQYKHGIGRISLLLPAGTIGSKETPLVAAQRELREETGYQADDWRLLGRFAANANYGCGTAHIFAARNARQVAEPDSGDLEDMEIVLLTPEDLANAVGAGEIAVLSTMMAVALATHPSFAGGVGAT